MFKWVFFVDVFFVLLKYMYDVILVKRFASGSNI